MQDTSIEVFLEDEPGRMVYVFKGAPDLQEARTAIQEVAALLRATGNAEHYRQALVDVSAGSIKRINPEEQKQLITYAARIREEVGLPTDGTRVAIVVAADVDFGMGRILQMRGEMAEPRIHRAIFKDRGEAYRWLETPGHPADLQPPGPG